MTTRNTSRRDMLKGGAAAAATLLAPEISQAAKASDIPRKAPDETRVVFLGGDYLHNFDAQRGALRRICEKAGWKFYDLHDARFLTPELVASADLLMIQRWGGGVPGWTEGPIHTEGSTNDNFMSDELEATIIDNVTKRGMGFMSLHCTVANWDRPNFMKFMGVNGIIHGPLQLVHCHDFNQDHPITQGIEDFDIPWDENFGAEPTGPDVDILYEATGGIDKRHDIAGWAVKRGKGRVAGLTAGHTYFAFRDPNYLELYRRAAWWALGREIPAKS